MKRALIVLSFIFFISSMGCSNKANADKAIQASSTLKSAVPNENISSNTFEENESTPLVPIAENHTNTNNTITSTSTDSSINILNLSKLERNWYYVPATKTKAALLDSLGIEYANKYSGYYLSKGAKKSIYLTFDEGYENGYTGEILDILKNNNVKAAFFVTKPYITSNKELIKRMADEGHLVCNHSNTHPSMASITDEANFNEELLTVEAAYKDATGSSMPKFFRPPMGKYSELSLYYTKKLGYKTIFWSFAYMDWDRTKQPTKEYAVKKILEKTHDGGIYLLHAVSKTNAEILDSLIKEWKTMGYELSPLNNLK